MRRHLSKRQLAQLRSRAPPPAAYSPTGMSAYALPGAAPDRAPRLHVRPSLHPSLAHSSGFLGLLRLRTRARPGRPLARRCPSALCHRCRGPHQQSASTCASWRHRHRGGACCSGSSRGRRASSSRFRLCHGYRKGFCWCRHRRRCSRAGACTLCRPRCCGRSAWSACAGCCGRGWHGRRWRTLSCGSGRQSSGACPNARGDWQRPCCRTCRLGC